MQNKTDSTKSSSIKGGDEEDGLSVRESIMKKSAERSLSRLPPDEVRAEALELIKMADSVHSRKSRNRGGKESSVSAASTTTVSDSNLNREEKKSASSRDSSVSDSDLYKNKKAIIESFMRENDDEGFDVNPDHTVTDIQKLQESSKKPFINYVFTSFRSSRNTSLTRDDDDHDHDHDHDHNESGNANKKEILEECEDLIDRKLKIKELRRPFELRKEAMKLLELERNQIFSQSTDETWKDGNKKLFTTDLAETLDRVKEKLRMGYFEIQLPNDMFSFIMLIPTFFSSSTFVVITSLALQILSAGLFFSSKTEFNQDKFNPWNLPANVDITTRVAQITALCIAVFTQDDLIISISQIFDGYAPLEEVFASHNITRFKWMTSIFIRFSTSLFILFVTWLVIVQESTVVDVFLEFVAISFVGQLDNAFFFIASKGLVGRRSQKMAFHIRSEKICIKRNAYHTKSLRFVALALPLLTLLSGWSYIVHLQNSGWFLTSTIAVQFADEFSPPLGTFTGLYDIRSGIVINGRAIYQERDWGDHFFAYCDKESSWTLSNAKSFSQIDPCTYKAKSKETSTFVVSDTFSENWNVVIQDRGTDELEHLWSRIFDCRMNNNICGNHGKCLQNSGNDTNAGTICECDGGWFGLFCNFRSPCEVIEIDEREEGFRGTKVWSTKYRTLKFKDNSLATFMFRPIYVNQIESTYDILLFTGRRWVLTSSDRMPELATSRQINDTNSTIPLTEDILAKYITEDFQPTTSSWTAEFISESLDFGTPKDAITPIGILWYGAKKNSEAIGFFSIASSNEQNAPLICTKCDNQTNPCFYDSYCNVNGTCECVNGGKGTLCQVTPQNNGMCDEFFNSVVFDYDGGDCCQATCKSSEFQCGSKWNLRKDLIIYAGFRECKDPEQVCDSCWKQLTNVVSSQETSPDRYSFVAGYGKKHMDMSADARILIVSDGASSEGVQAYTLDGTSWVKKGTLIQDPDKSFMFGESLAISGNGDILATNGLNTNKGDLQVFNWEQFKWRFRQRFEGETSNGLYGTSVSLSFEGRMLAVRAPGIFGRERESKVYVYNYNAQGNYVQIGNTITSTVTTDSSGIALSNDGKIVAIGNTDDGASEVYTLRGNLWERLGSPLPGPNFAKFGASIDVSNDGMIVAIGAPLADLTQFKAGMVSVYAWDGTEWQQRGDNILGDSDSAHFGHSVSLSSDGSILAIGGDKRASSTVSAKVFRWDGTHEKWERLGGFIPGGLVNVVKISGDGSSLAVSSLNGESPNRLETSLYKLIQQGNQCEEGFSEVVISVRTDQRPKETHFTVTNSTGFKLFSKYYPFGIPSVTEKKMCIPNDECFIFEIFDTNGDGICCSNGNGSYSVWVNGEEVASGGKFKYYDKVLIGNCETACPEGKELFRVEMLTDDHASELYWSFKHEGANDTLLSGSSYPDDTLQFIIEETCIASDECHIFEVAEDCEWKSFFVAYNADCGLGFEDVITYEYIYPTHKNKGDETKPGYSLNLNGVEVGNNEGYKIKRIHRIGLCGPACDNGKSLLRIGLRTDGDGDEITWTFREESNRTSILEGGPYSVIGNEVEDICVDTNNECFIFTIYDSKGNGMMNANCWYICAGAYYIALDEKELRFNGEFEYSDSFRFGNCDPTHEPTKEPSRSPSTQPSMLPSQSLYPSKNPTISNSPSLSLQPTMNSTGLCKSPRRDLIEFNIFPDLYGEEFTWNLTNHKDSSKPIILSGGPYPNSFGKSFSYPFCMDLNKDCYFLGLYDSGCDGFCKGFCLGKYTILVNGEKAIDEN